MTATSRHCHFGVVSLSHPIQIGYHDDQLLDCSSTLPHHQQRSSSITLLPKFQNMEHTLRRNVHILSFALALLLSSSCNSSFEYLQMILLRY